jgi:putative ABC transport system permease protein
VTLTLQTGSADRTVGAVYDAGPLFSGYVASRESLLAAGAKDLDQQVLIKLAPGANPDQVRADLDAALADYPIVRLQDQTEFKDQIRSQINQLLAIIYALLGLAVIIAILGIVNTLALSVAERTREIGLLRAVGATRPQIRQMIRRESLLIAVFGALLGVAVGVTFGVLLQRVLADAGITELGIPWALLVVVLVVAAIVGVIAAVWPARRAAKLDVLQAVTTE